MQAFLEGDLGRLENYFVLGSPERQKRDNVRDFSSKTVTFHGDM